MVDAKLRKVLAVDDEELLLQGYRRGFGRTHVVFTATNAAQALAIAEAERPDLVVLDLRIGTDWGLTLITQLRLVLSTSTIVLVSGYLSIAATVDAMKAGADHVMSKPTTASRILRAIGEDRPLEPGQEAMPTLAMTNWEHLMRAIAEAGGNISEAARRLGIRRTSLQRKLKRGPRD